MPSISVTPESPPESAGGGPVIAGYAMPRPNSRATPVEPLRSVVVLGSGATRAYDQGVRRVFSFSWAKLTERDLEGLETAIRAPYVPLEVDAGVEPVIVSTEEGISVDAVPGTYPIRYAVSVTLKARDPLR